MAGGGSTLTLPALIFMGLDSATANGTNRIAILIQNIAAVKSFKDEDFFHFKDSIKLSLLTLPGAILGALISVRISDELFQKILAIIMIGILLTLIIPRKKIESIAKLESMPFWIYPAMIGIGFYGGFIQVGVGFIIMSALYYLLKLNLLYVNMHKVFIVLIYTIPTLIIFIVNDSVNWTYGLVLSLGNAIGGWWSAKISVKKGDNIVRIVLFVTIIIMSLKLLDVF